MQQNQQKPPVIRTESVSAMLNKESYFYIPQFQRNYAWSVDSDPTAEERHVNELLEDLWTAFEDDDKNYFLGTIITYKAGLNEGEREDAGREFVIDGQQRLTTLTFMFAAMYKVLKGELDKDTSNQKIKDSTDFLLGSLKKNINVRGAAGIKNLIESSNKSNNRFLQDFFNSLDATSRPDPEAKDEDGNDIYENCDKYFDAIDECDNWALAKLLKHDVDKILEFEKFVSEYVYFSYVPTENFLEAYTIFERQNDRGAELLFSDIVKHFILNELAKKGKENFNKAADMVNDKWQEIETKIIRKGEHGADFKFDEFVRYFFVSEYRKFLRPRGVIPWLKKEKKNLTELENPMKFIELMDKKADWFINLRNNKNASGIPNNSLKFIKRFLDSQQHLMVMLAALQLPAGKFKKAALHIESLIFITRWAGTSPAKFEGKIELFINALFNTKNPIFCYKDNPCEDKDLDCLHRCFHHEENDLKCKDVFEHEIKEFIQGEISNAKSNIIDPEKLQNLRSGASAPMISKYIIHRTEQHFRDDLAHVAKLNTFGDGATRNKDGKALINVDHILELNNTDTQKRAFKGLTRFPGGFDKYIEITERIGNLTLLSYHENQNEFHSFTPKEKFQGKELLYCEKHERYFELDEECNIDRNKDCPLIEKVKPAFASSHNLELTRRMYDPYITGTSKPNESEVVAKEFGVDIIKLRNNEHWTEDEVIQRETVYFKILSHAYGFIFDPHSSGYKIKGNNIL